MLLINKAEEEALNKNISYLINFSLFQNVKREDIRSLWKISKEKEFFIGQIVFCEKDKLDYIYVIKNGDFKVLFKFYL